MTGRRAAELSTAQDATLPAPDLPAAPAPRPAEGDPEPAGAPVLDRGASIDRYLVLSLLGRGGMGEVYAAYDPELDRRVALKLLHIARGSEAARALLLREARSLGKLSHPNVVVVHDVGEHQGDVFVAMELVEGESLAAWCQGEPRPPWQEVLAAYLDAARGLEAAHDKGLVHRDVKPANILRGNDGRVRVADFGIAAGGGGDEHLGAAEPVAPGVGDGGAEALTTGETLPAPAVSSGSGAWVTAPGAVLGTPLYMAPEQHEGPRVTPASDQYSFCVSLYEGLYGAPPFDAPPGVPLLAHLLAQKKLGPPSAPPAGSPVPAWVHRALVRGLAFRPGERYPSMPALIAAFGEDPDQRRRARWRRAGAFAAAAALLAVAALGWARGGAIADPCGHPEQQLSGAWDFDVRARVRAALLGTGRSYAEVTAARVGERLDAYAAAWIAMRGEVCRASRGGKERSEILARRDLCLDRRRGRLAALTALLAARPDPEVLDKAVQAVAGLNPVGTCADSEALMARVRPPEDADLRARVTALQPRVDQLEALCTAGKHKEGLALGEPLLGEVSTLAYPPLRAEVQYWVGRLRAGAADYAGARALLGEATVSAAEGRDDVLDANAWAELLFVVSEDQQRLDEAAVIRELGRGAVARAQDDRAEASWESSVGAFLGRKGAYAESRAALTRAVALREKALGPDHPLVGASLNNLGALLDDMGDWGETKAIFLRALAIKEKTLGPEHPSIALSLNNLAVAIKNTGDYAGAIATYERALAMWERTLGPDHPRLATALTNLGEALDEAGDEEGAVTVLSRALAIRQKALGPDHPDLGSVLTALGRVRVHLGQLDAAQPLLERALLLKEKALGRQNPELDLPLLGLGELYLARGKPEAALPFLERALPLRAARRAQIQLTLAEALWQVGKDRPRALSLAEEARASYQRLGHGPGRERAERWLTEHRRR